MFLLRGFVCLRVLLDSIWLLLVIVCVCSLMSVFEHVLLGFVVFVLVWCC